MRVNDSGRSFARWQTITRDQLTYAINLILGLSVAALGFELSLVLNWKVNDLACTNIWAPLVSCTFVATSALSVLILAMSICIGIFVITNRLRDFRLTQEIARRREDNATDQELDADRKQSLVLGDRTWVLFTRQICSFGVGIFFAVLSVSASAALKVL